MSIRRKMVVFMLYCTKCRAVCEDSTQKCPNCKNARSLRIVNNDDFVLVHRVDEYTAQRLTSAFDDFSIGYQFENFGEGRVSYLYDSEIMPTDKTLYVRYGDFSTAMGIASQIEQEIERERQGEPEEFEEMPRRKRILVQSLSVVAFLLLVMLAVFGADAIANWIRGLMQ